MDVDVRAHEPRCARWGAPAHQSLAAHAEEAFGLSGW
jgi:hypothetical protein